MCTYPGVVQAFSLGVKKKEQSLSVRGVEVLDLETLGHGWSRN